MTIITFFKKQELGRQMILNEIHQIIINGDKAVQSQVGSMMGKEMILYKAAGVFKYGLASVKNYMSLHVMPMYGSPKLHSKYQKFLNKAQFQKGCINFKNAESMPLDVVRELIDDCSKIDLVSIMEEIKRNPESKYY